MVVRSSVTHVPEVIGYARFRESMLAIIKSGKLCSGYLDGYKLFVATRLNR